MIKINGETLHTESKPSLIFMANDIENKGRSHKSYSVDVVNNSHNDRLLGGTFSRGYYRETRHDGLIEIDGFEFPGYLLITGINKRQASALFVSGSGLLWQQLENVNLREVDFTNFDRVLNLANVKASEDGGDVIFDVTDRGAFINNVSEFRDSIDITERYPAINIKALLQRLFLKLETGLTITGDIDKTYLLFTQERDVRNDAEWLKENVTELTANQTEGATSNTATGTVSEAIYIKFTSVGNIDPNNRWDNSDLEYTVPETGTYRFGCNVELSIDMSDNGGNVPKISFGAADGKWQGVIQVVKDKTTVIHQQAKTLNANLGAGLGMFNVDTSYIELQAGDKISFRALINFDYDFPTFASPWTLTVGIEGNQFTKLSRWYGAGSTIPANKVLPDMSALEFLRDLFKYLNIDVYYSPFFQQVELIQRKFAPATGETIEVFDYSEQLNEAANVELEYSTDKSQTPGSDLITITGAKSTKKVDFGFSKTLFAPVYRLVNNFKATFPVLWQANNPLVDFFSADYEVPERETRGNLRLLRYEGKISGDDYIQTFGGELNTSSETAKTFPAFVQVDVVPLHRWQYRSDDVRIRCKAKLTPEQVFRLYRQDLFKQAVALKLESGQVIATGVITEANQLNGDVYELNLRRL